VHAKTKRCSQKKIIKNMKDRNIMARLYKLVVLLMLIIHCTIVSSQSYQDYSAPESYIRASNNNCLLLMPQNGYGSFTWSGNCDNGYCDGYGTANYYDFNGNYAGRFVGKCSQGLREGFGTRYYADGIIRYQGNYSNDRWDDEPKFTIGENLLRDLIIDSLLMGGINRHSEITQSIFSSGGDLKKICFYISCNGQYFSSNFYELTVVVSPDDSVPVHFENVNDNAKGMITLKTAIWGIRLYNWFSKEFPDKDNN
jgi:hypothetical protein